MSLFGTMPTVLLPPCNISRVVLTVRKVRIRVGEPIHTLLLPEIANIVSV